jgi:hypothetical protein
MSKRKPEQFQAFEQLTKRLMAVPKTELDKQVDHYNARKAEQKKHSKKKT